MYYSSPLVLSPVATPIEALELKKYHKEDQRLYLECKNAEKSLIRQIQDTLDNMHIKSLVDKYTNIIIEDIPIILNYLFYDYEQVRFKDVIQKENKVLLINWLPTDSIVLLTRPLENIQKFAETCRTSQHSIHR